MTKTHALFLEPKSVIRVYGELVSPQRGQQNTDRGANPCTNDSISEPRRGDTPYEADYLSPLQGFVLGVRFFLQAKFFNYCSKVQIAG